MLASMGSNEFVARICSKDLSPGLLYLRCRIAQAAPGGVLPLQALHEEVACEHHVGQDARVTGQLQQRQPASVHYLHGSSRSFSSP